MHFKHRCHFVYNTEKEVARISNLNQLKLILVHLQNVILNENANILGRFTLSLDLQLQISLIRTWNLFLCLVTFTTLLANQFTCHFLLINVENSPYLISDNIFMWLLMIIKLK